MRCLHVGTRPRASCIHIRQRTRACVTTITCSTVDDIYVTINNISVTRHGIVGMRYPVVEDEFELIFQTVATRLKLIKEQRDY